MTCRFGTKCGADQIAAGAIQCVQNTEQRFLGDGRSTKCKECLSFKSQEQGNRFDDYTDPVEDNVCRITAETVGQYKTSRAITGVSAPDCVSQIRMLE